MTFPPTMRLLILSLPLLWLAAPTLSQPLSTERLAERMLEIGADGAALADLAHTPPRADMDEALGAERSEMLRRAWGRAFAFEHVRSDVVGHIVERHRGTDVASGLEWLRLPAVARATTRMREATGADFDGAFGEWMMQVREDGVELDEERVNLIVRISERSGEDRVGEVVLSLAEASIRGAHAVAPRSDRPSLEDALQRLRAMGPTLTAQAVVQNQLYLYYVLQDLSLQELQDYAAALDQQAGRWYVSTMGDAVAHAIEQSARRLVREAEALARRP